MHPVFQVCPAHGRGAFGTQRESVAAPVLEGVGLLLDNVGDLADAAHEQARILEHGGVDTPVAEAVRDLLRPVLEEAPIGLVARQNVRGAAGGLEYQRERSVA